MPVTSTTSPPTRVLEPVLDADAAIVRGFARAVADALDAGPLTLAARDRLIGRAERLGIRRFEANLIVAAVEQQARSRRRMRLVVDAPEPKHAGWYVPASAALVVQTLIAAAAWWLLG